ncbi:MAG: FkbM family methyltransferase, partial [Planctomycetes bacterium]|nr:FkbM family methyltransferase [Planctomycetota bacterium]
HSLVNESGEDDTQSMEVSTDTVDACLADRRPISFLRLDIEGYEAIVIDGMQDTLMSPKLRRMFIEIHPALIEADRMQRFLMKLLEAGFETTHVISRDNWQRAVLGQAKVEQITLSQLMQDERILHKRNAFEIFFEKHGESP